MANHVTLGTVYRFFMPLILMTELNMISKSVINAVLARSPDQSVTLAAFHLAFILYFALSSSTDHALTFKLDQLTGAGQAPLVGNVIYLFPSRHFTRLRRLPCTFLGGYDARTDFRIVHHA